MTLLNESEKLKCFILQFIPLITLNECQNRYQRKIQRYNNV